MWRESLHGSALVEQFATTGLRRRGLILAVLGYHTERDLASSLRTDIEWAPVLAPGLVPAAPPSLTAG